MIRNLIYLFWLLCLYLGIMYIVCVCVCVCALSRFSCVWLFVILWTIDHQAPLSMGFSRQGYWSELPCPPPGDLPSPGTRPRRILYCLSHKGSPRTLEWVAYPFSRGSSQPRDRTEVSCIVGGFFTSWATRKAPSWHYVNLVILQEALYIPQLFQGSTKKPHPSANVPVLVGAGCSNKIPYTWWLTPQIFISPFWRLESPKSRCQQILHPDLCLHMAAGVGCFSLLIRALISFMGLP